MAGRPNDVTNTILASVLPTLIAALLAAYTYRQSRIAKDKATQVAAVRADMDAYENARKTWESVNRSQSEQMERLRVDVGELGTQVTRLSGRVATLEEEVRSKDQKLTIAFSFIRTLLSITRTYSTPNIPLPPQEIAADVT